MTKDKEMQETAMKIILHSGNAKNIGIQAFEFAKDAKFKQAKNEMKKAHEEIVKAHNAQTDIIQAEARGESTDYSPLFTHAQDTLMTVSNYLDLTSQMIEILEIMKKEVL